MIFALVVFAHSLFPPLMDTHVVYGYKTHEECVADGKEITTHGRYVKYVCAEDHTGGE